LVFDGFTKVRGANKSDDDVLLPAVKVGEILKLEKLDPSQHFTKPPARFTEASLVKELEKRELVVHRLMLRLFQPFKNVVM
jgi:DNA topoisomerase-1